MPDGRYLRSVISPTTRACLYNSFNFDFTRLRRFAEREARMVHRVDGPIGAYRGFDDGTDGNVAGPRGRDQRDRGVAADHGAGRGVGPRLRQ